MCIVIRLFPVVFSLDNILTFLVMIVNAERVYRRTVHAAYHRILRVPLRSHCTVLEVTYLTRSSLHGIVKISNWINCSPRKTIVTERKTAANAVDLIL